jgi:hypothetical protein
MRRMARWFLGNGLPLGARSGNQKPPCLAAGSERLDGGGVFQALHTFCQAFNLPLLLFQEQVFNPIQSRVDALNIFFNLSDILPAGHVRVDHGGKRFNGGG